jgi:hypothetical protein
MSQDTSSREPTTIGGISIVASVLVNDVYQEFAYASHTIHPSPAPRDARRYTLASQLPRQPVAVGTLSEGNQPVVACPPHLLGY